MDPPLEITVRCRGIFKTYGTGHAKVTALHGADLDVWRGELLMLVGPSGCGKTSLISIIATLLDQDSGTCEVLGQDLRRVDPLVRARFRGQSIGFVFQAFNLLPTLTTVENISVPLLINGLSWTRAEARASELLDSVGLAGRERALPAQLSGGEQQRVAIARALACDPKLLICDEPTSNLDHETGRAMMDLLRRQAKHPERTIIVVTHDPRILDFADRVARMDDGRIVSTESGAAHE